MEEKVMMLGSEAGQETGEEEQEAVESANRRFYNRFRFPPPPLTLDLLADPQFSAQALSQSIGAWEGDALPRRPRIWVAGCGRYQALTTALRFPAAEVVGSDIAEESLAECERLRQALGVGNLTLRRQSLLELPSSERFDYVLSIGVLHHLSDPAAGFEAVRRALQPTGIAEIMVYNQAHRQSVYSYQKAIQLLASQGQGDRLEVMLQLGRRLLVEYPVPGRMGQFVQVSDSEELFADTFLQPVEHSFTVESLVDLAQRCGLQILQPRLSSWDTSWNQGLWALDLKDPLLVSAARGLTDLKRWCLVNHLRQEDAPLLWFYFQRQDSPRERRSEDQLDGEFLRAVFRRRSTTARRFQLQELGDYLPLAEPVVVPSMPGEAEQQAILAAVDGSRTMATVLENLGLQPTKYEVYRLRISLTTPLGPHLSFVRFPADGRDTSPPRPPATTLPWRARASR